MSVDEMYPDATALISTLIAIYGIFLTVFVGLFPATLRRLERELFLIIALVMVIIAIGLDLYRTLNSLGDLLGTTLRTLPRHKVIDAEHEAIWWFIGNLVLLALALLARWKSTADSGGASGKTPGGVLNG